MPTTSRGLTYPASTSHTRIWEHVQTLAEDVNDELDSVASPPVADLRQTTAQTFTTGVWAAVTFGAEDIDTASGHSTSSNTSRYTCQVAGTYLITGGVAWAANVTGSRWCRWVLNGTEIFGGGANMMAVTSSGQQTLLVARTVILALSVGDYMELHAVQFSGGNLDTYVAVGYTQSSMSAVRISD